jgi:hypothetical protein
MFQGRCLDAVPVGDVRGYEGSERGGPFSVDGADPACSSEGRSDQARFHRFRVMFQGRCLDAVPVGDVRGYEGSERGGPFSIDGADSAYSSEYRPDQARFHRFRVMFQGRCLDAVPVGDVRGYEGSERGGSFSIDGADSAYSSEYPPDQARSPSRQTHRAARLLPAYVPLAMALVRRHRQNTQERLSRRLTGLTRHPRMPQRRDQESDRQ